MTQCIKETLSHKPDSLSLIPQTVGVGEVKS